MDSHLLPFSEHFDIWRRFCLRSTGFPARLALGLGEPATARAADDVVDLRRAADEARVAAMAACSKWIDAAEGDDRAAAVRAFKTLRAERTPESPADATTRTAVATWQELCERVAEAEARLAACSAQDHARTTQALRSFAADDRVRQAIAWQNRAVLASGFDRYLEVRAAPGEVSQNRRVRAMEQLLASYLQRYCVKNDSVGFFGPIGWGTWAEDEAWRLVPGERLHGEIDPCLERWAVQELARAITRLPNARRWIPPRRSALLNVQGTTVVGPFGAFELPPQEARLLTACDGIRTADAIFRSMSDSGMAQDEAERVLSKLADQGFVRWALEMPGFAVHYEDVLTTWLGTVEDEAVRSAVVPMIEQLAAASRGCAAATSASELIEALDVVDTTFNRLTGAAATRAPGQMYAGRTMFRPAAVRDVQLAVSAAVRRQIAGPLELLASAACWWSAEIGKVFETSMRTMFNQIVAGSSEPHITLMSVIPEVQRLFPRAGGAWSPDAVAVNDELQRRWAAALGLRSGARRIDVSSSDIRAAVMEAFPADGPGWPAARCHSPDVMIAAPTFEAVTRGECTFVLGEAHFFLNSIQQGTPVRVYPDHEELVRGLQRDYPRGRLLPTALGSGSGCSFAEHPADAIIDVDGVPPAWVPPSQVVPISDLIAVQIDGRVYVSTRDGRRRWAIQSALDAALCDHGLALFARTAHSPRVTIDNLVVARETWRFGPGDMEFAKAKDSRERFIAARDFVRRHGMPRLCFYKAGNEVKPCFIDFESPIFVEALAKVARTDTDISVSEMLPTPDDCWLRDRDGNAYASEIRMVLVDKRAYVPAPHEV